MTSVVAEEICFLPTPITMSRQKDGEEGKGVEVRLRGRIEPGENRA